MAKNFVEELKWRGMLAQISQVLRNTLTPTWCLPISELTLLQTLCTSVTFVVS